MTRRDSYGFLLRRREDDEWRDYVYVILSGQAGTVEELLWVPYNGTRDRVIS